MALRVTSGMWEGESLTQVTFVHPMSLFGLWPISANRVMPTDEERDSRSGDQWMLSVVSYLNYRSGTAWRKINRAGERYNETRWFYLSAIRLLNELRYAPVTACECSRCAIPPKKPVVRARLPIQSKVGTV